MRLFWTKFFFDCQNTKKAHLRPVLVKSQNRLDIRKERPIFDLEPTWFVLVTLETDSIAKILKKNPRGLGCCQVLGLWFSNLSGPGFVVSNLLDPVFVVF